MRCRGNQLRFRVGAICVQDGSVKIRRSNLNPGNSLDLNGQVALSTGYEIASGKNRIGRAANVVGAVRNSFNRIRGGG